ncbi:WecB/TagA/CpsF family glycosyltransferase [Gelria sp. Kuro-4]|uniref:WecB/TagA/CpsF family glycosyltransferase n=1 Tax=Gelria sp. Kuro-4 TaxID=2796927 RepID=UPI001BEEEB0F|nr:WecB/TagA/CpsF family glycosyltransferase [Gelria sp. Kuro-4]BCV25472.1 N-acetylmannosaminyltransferase [Gelria sp. Kuro-4]
MRERVWVLGVPLWPVGLREALALAARWLRESGAGPRLIFTPNAEIIARAQQDPALKAALAAADLTVPDGIGVVWAARLLGTPVPERVPGIELLEAVLALAARESFTVYFLGGRPGVAEEAARRLKERWPTLPVAGTHHGYFSAAEEPAVLAEIQAAAPDILVAALGAPKQELWLTRHRRELPARLALGVGGSLDVFAGRVERAPQLFRGLGLEWLYRLLRQPRRLGRALLLPRFVLAVLGEALAGGRRRE